MVGVRVLSSEGAVVHEEEINVAGLLLLAGSPQKSKFRVFRTVVDEESLVAGRHKVAGLLVGAVADLWCDIPSAHVRVVMSQAIANFVRAA